MGELKIVLNDKLLNEFRKKAMKKFGYGKGSLSKAAEKAIEEWVGREKEDFVKSLEEVAGIWRDKEGYEFVREIRKESERRIKRLNL